MRNLLFLLLLLGLLGCDIEIVSDVVQEAQWCLPSRGKPLAIAEQYPAAGATEVDPHSVVVVQLDTDKLMKLSSFGIDVVDSADSRWHYVTGGGGSHGRFVAYPEDNFVEVEDAVPPTNSLYETIAAATFDEIAHIRTLDHFSPNAEVTITIRANCYDPYIFSFTTGELE